MIRLLRANFSRVWKPKALWICMAGTLALELVNCISTINSNDDWWAHTSDLFLENSTNPLLFAVIFGAVFIGTEFSDGAVRGKLIVGHTRTQIYLANLAAVSAGYLTIYLVQWIPVIVMSCFGTEFGMTANEFAFKVIIAVCAYLAAAGFFTFLATLIAKKSTGIAVSVISLYVLTYIGFGISGALYEPEYFIDTEAGENGIEQTVPNKNYVSGTKRRILETINDIHPMGQLMQMEERSLHNPNIMPLYSLGVLAITTSAGVIVFRKKGLK